MRNTRRNNRDTGSSKKSGFIKFIPLIVLVVAIVAVVVFAAKPKSSGKTGPQEKINPIQPAAPKTATIYIDNSASMKGYAKANSYIAALSDLVSLYPGTDVRFTSNDTLHITSGSELVNKLTNGTLPYTGQSLLNEDLKKIVESVGKDNKIAFFVTDGIMCGPDSEVKRDPNYNIHHASELKNQIRDAFKDKGVGVSVYRLISEFNGEYYCMDNDHKVINSPRSFFIIAIGAPSAVADFKGQIAQKQQNPLFKINPTNEIDFIEPRTINQGITVYGGGNGTTVLELDDKSNASYEWSKVNNAPVIFNISIDDFKNYSLSPKELASKTEILINDVKYKTGATFDSLRNSIRAEVEWNRVSNSSAGTKVEIRIPYFDAPWINSQAISNEDDKFMINGLPNPSTFLFNYFIGGIKEGMLTDPNNFFIFDRTVTLKQKK